MRKLKLAFEIASILTAVGHVVLFVIHTPERWQWLVVTGLVCVLLIFWLAFLDRSSLTRRIGRRVRRTFEKQPFVTWFLERDAAKPVMLRAWRTHSRLVFVGLSQRSLKTYLSDELAGGRAYAWESIDIYFASDQLGNAVEESDFFPNIKQSRQEIAAELTSPSRSYQLPHLREVRFFQYNPLVGFSGSFYSSGSSEPDMIFVVESLPTPRGETKKALTFVIEADGTEIWNKAHAVALKHYRDSLHAIEGGREQLGAFAPSIWDKSAQDWSEFCRKSKVMEAEINGLIAQTGSLAGLRVLDVGCASGETSERLLAAGAGHLTALDQSPQMIQSAKRRLRGTGKVDFALCKIPSTRREDIDLEGEAFDLVVLHQVIPSIASDRGEVERLALWCKSRMVSGGRVVLAAHNTAISFGHSPWDDPFRKALRDLAKSDKDLCDMLRPERQPLPTNDVEQSFEKAGFQLSNKSDVTIPIEMEDRILMWKSLAVADSFLNVRKATEPVVRSLVEKAAGQVRGLPTKERTVRYWVFTC